MAVTCKKCGAEMIVALTKQNAPHAKCPNAANHVAGDVPAPKPTPEPKAEKPAPAPPSPEPKPKSKGFFETMGWK